MWLMGKGWPVPDAAPLMTWSPMTQQQRQQQKRDSRCDQQRARGVGQQEETEQRSTHDDPQTHGHREAEGETYGLQGAGEQAQDCGRTNGWAACGFVGREVLASSGQVMGCEWPGRFEVLKF